MLLWVSNVYCRVSDALLSPVSCCRIDQRRREVVERRERVKDKCADRHNQLLSSQALQEFKRDAEEVSGGGHRGGSYPLRKGEQWGVMQLQRGAGWHNLIMCCGVVLYFPIAEA